MRKSLIGFIHGVKWYGWFILYSIGWFDALKKYDEEQKSKEKNPPN